MSSGIETTFAEHRFRSRLEARWAAFFDLLGWPWVYEPFDLDGYIPDFVLRFKEPVLVEVKPVFLLADCATAARKIAGSSWEHEALVVGADWCIDEPWDDSPVLGLLAEFSPGFYEPGLWFHCLFCGRPSFRESSGSWHCRVSGCHEGRHHIAPASSDDLRALWGRAHLATRWQPRAPCPTTSKR